LNPAVDRRINAPQNFFIIYINILQIISPDELAAWRRSAGRIASAEASGQRHPRLTSVRIFSKNFLSKMGFPAAPLET